MLCALGSDWRGVGDEAGRRRSERLKSFVAFKLAVFEISIKLLVVSEISPNCVTVSAVLQAAFCRLQNVRRYAFHLSLEKTSLFTCVAAAAVCRTSLNQYRVCSPCHISSFRCEMCRRHANRPAKL